MDNIPIKEQNLLDIPDFSGIDINKRDVLLDISNIKDVNGYIVLQEKLCDGEFFINENLRKIYSDNLETIKQIALLAAKVNELFPKGLELKKIGDLLPLILTKQEVGCLIALMFFGLFKKKPSKNFQIQRNFAYFHTKLNCAEQLKCILVYFKRLLELSTEIRCTQKLVFTRQRLNESVLNIFDPRSDVSDEDGPLISDFEADHKKKIEDFSDTVNIDFANKFIGGLVLTGGLMQEEIKFMASPECLVSILIFEKMADDEAIHIIGTERYIDFDGFSASFKIKAQVIDESPLLNDVKITAISAIDALVTYSLKDKGGQYSPPAIHRELVKATTGFSVGNYEEVYPNGKETQYSQLYQELRRLGIATGKWGCGIYGGDSELKFLIQLAAATVLERKLFFSSFGDITLCGMCNYMKDFLKEKKLGFLRNFLYSLKEPLPASVFNLLLKWRK